MNPSQALTAPRPLIADPRPLRAGGKLDTSGASLNGMLLFVSALFVFGSGIVSLRPTVMGLALHPYLVPLAIAFPFVVMSRIHVFPSRILAALLIFTAMSSFSVFNGGNVAFGEIFKLLCSVLTIVTVALLVRKRGDFVLCALGLSIAVALLAARGLREESAIGVEAIQGANRNSYSLFALPAILLAGFIGVRMNNVSSTMKMLLLGCSIPALAAIFMSGNRSGYLGSVLIGLMLFWDRKGRGTLVVGVVAAAVVFWMVQFGSTAMFEQRIKETTAGNKSDDERKEIILACIEIGMENPVIGVSPQMLAMQIGRRLSVKYRTVMIEAHNVFAHVWAASGVICFASMIAVGWTMWSWKPSHGRGFGGKDDPQRDARRLMRMTVILWFVRGNFTREILFSPSFNIGIGLAIGLCLLAEAASNQQYAAENRGPGPGGLLPGTAG